MAARKSKQRSTRNQSSPSLDDPLNWLMLPRAHRTRSEQLSGAEFSPVAHSHLFEALKNEKLCCMRESRIKPNEREMVPASFWYRQEILMSALRSSNMSSRPKALGPIYGWTYYVLKPDFDRLWPSAADQTLTETSARRRPGKTPKYDWPLKVAREVIRRIESGGKHPNAPAMIEYCKKTIRYEPDDSDMRKLLKFLRGH